VIVEPFEPIRRSLSRLIERRPGWRVTGEVASAEAGMRLAYETCPDVAIVELRLGGADALEWISTLSVVAPDVRTLGYSLRDDGGSGARFVEAGGHGFVGKEESPQALLDAIEQALAGKVRVPVRVPAEASPRPSTVRMPSIIFSSRKRHVL
jgi:DNA-binding NarL/FixJ family response regulator